MNNFASEVTDERAQILNIEKFFVGLWERLDRFRRSTDSDLAGSLDSPIDLIVEETASHPYHVQWAGWHIVDIWRRHGGKWGQPCEEELLRRLHSLQNVQV